MLHAQPPQRQGPDQYVELELAGRDADREVPGMGAHLEGCPACREEHESLLALADNS